MKTLLTSCAILAALLFMTAMGFLQETQAQQPASPEAIVPAPSSAGQYRVLDIGRVPLIKNRTAAETLEIILNELAVENWRVTATTGSFIILSR